MNKKEILNAKISGTSITMADHGCLTFWVHLDGDGWGGNIGGYCIGKGFPGAKNFTAESGLGLVAMMRIMDVVGVTEWEDLARKYVRVEMSGWGGKIEKIGNIINDKWFDIHEFFESAKGAK